MQGVGHKCFIYLYTLSVQVNISQIKNLFFQEWNESAAEFRNEEENVLRLSLENSSSENVSRSIIIAIFAIC